MARIVYGVSGEGSGHSSRARVVAAHLEARGHEVWIVSYGRGVTDLKERFNVFETEGLHLATVDNAVSVVKTFTENFARLADGHRKLGELKREVFRACEPDCVITDFEPMTAYLANHYDLPLISLDNQHRMRYMRYPCPRRLRADAIVTETVIRAMVPRPDASLVTTFFRGEVKNDHTFLFPPILRPEVLNAVPEVGSHVLVYFTRGFESVIAMLKSFGREHFRIYGAGRAGEEGHLSFRAFSRDGFLEDLRSCKAVIASAGFTLMTESLYLTKPFLAMPMKGQFEQELNAVLLSKLGYGKCCRRATTEAIGDFLYHAPDYQTRLAGYGRHDNSEILSALDSLLANDCSEARRFRAR